MTADLYLLSHDDRAGTPLGPARSVAVGLAAGLLAEAVSSGIVRVHHDHLYLVPDAVVPSDPLLAQIVSDLAQTRGGAVPVGRWLRFMADDATSGVRSWLVRAGALQAVPRRVLGFTRPPVFVPVSWELPASRAVAVRAALNHPADATPPARLLVGLVHAAGLLDWLTRDDHRLRHAVPGLLAALPPDLRHLLAVTETAVASAALTPPAL
ncbi:GPP34 family phosphoprotein [Longispora sp. K20-0274]|uniref:GOLPH3/VPS74 family protein n=1 Tax=Longispora sp. K20-0274 TaxID=3088255 RepID=UPI00399AAD9D